MDGLSVDILGNMAVLENLEKATIEVQVRAQAKLEEAGQMAKDYADANAPVKTGFLRSKNALTVRPGRVMLSNAAPYALPVVLGHHTRSGSYVAPNDFIRPGWIGAGYWLKDALRGLI